MARLTLILNLFAVAIWSRCLPATADNGGKRGGASPSISGDFLSEFLDSIKGIKDGGSGMQEMMQKLALKMAGSAAGEDIPSEAAFEGFPELAKMMGGSGGSPGMGALSGSPAFQALAEKFLSEDGADGGLLKQFRELQTLSDGPMDLDKLTSTFKGLSKALRERGTDMNALMEEFLGSSHINVPPVPPPKGLKHLYKKTASQIIPDSQGTDLIRPSVVSLSAIKNSIGTFSEQLPRPISGVKCQALILSGGVARAPLQAGAVLGLAEQYRARQMPLKWDVVAGVNKGAISAATSLSFSPGQNGEIDWARFLWDHWHRVPLEGFTRCPKGMRDLMNLPRILEWLSDSQTAVSSLGGDPVRLGLPHTCETSVAAKTLIEMLQQLPEPPIAAGRQSRIAVVTAAKVGGGKGVWEFYGMGSGETCVVPPPSFPSERRTCQQGETEQGDVLLNPKTELDFMLAALLASNATPGVAPLVRVWGPQGGPYGQKGAYADGRLVANISAGEAIRACQNKIKREGGASEMAVKKGQGIMLDIIGTVPMNQSEVEEQLVQIAEKLKITKPTRLQTNKMTANRYIKQIKKAYPSVTIRHVLFPEEHFDLMSDYADFRSSRTLLQHGRLMGWRATTFEDVE